MMSVLLIHHPWNVYELVLIDKHVPYWHAWSLMMIAVLIDEHCPYWHVRSLFIIHETFIVLFDKCCHVTLLTCVILIDKWGPYWHISPIKLINRFFEYWYMCWCQYAGKRISVYERILFKPCQFYRTTTP